jgi:hypothetical protein
MTLSSTIRSCALADAYPIPPEPCSGLLLPDWDFAAIPNRVKPCAGHTFFKAFGQDLRSTVDGENDVSGTAGGERLDWIGGGS